MKKVVETLKNFNPTLTFIVAMPSTTILMALLLYLACRLSPADAVLSWIICFAGYVLGMPPGALSSPHKGEASNFQFLSSHIATLFSGYLLARLASPGVGTWFEGAASNPLRSGRVLLFVSFFVLGVVQTFVLRYYSDKDREQDEFKKAQAKTPGTA